MNFTATGQLCARTVVTLCLTLGVLALLATPAQARSGPQHVVGLHTSPSLTALKWKSVRNAAYYEIGRNSKLIARTSRQRYADRRVNPATTYIYKVRAVMKNGSRTRASHILPITTRARRACTYYAHSQGNDANPGTRAAPFRTINHLARQLGPGKHGCIWGTFSEDVTLSRSGTAARKAVLQSLPGTRAVIIGRFWIPEHVRYHVVQHIDLDGRNATRLPSPTVNGDATMFLDNRITSRRTSICMILGSVNGYGRADRTVVDGNRITNCGTSDNHQHGIYVENARKSLITNNVIANNADRGIQLFPNAVGSYVAHNIIDGNGQGIIFSGSYGYASSGNTVTRNIISNSRIRYNIEHWWPAGEKIGTRNRAHTNCVYNGRDGNVTNPVGYRAWNNPVRAPRYRSRGRGDYRPGSGSRCRVLFSKLQPLR